jgi:hypothetical protein
LVAGYPVGFGFYMPKLKLNQVGKIENKTSWLWFLVGLFG